MVERLQAAWDRHFFQPTPAASLAAFRIAFYLAAFLHEIYHYQLRYYVFPPYLFKATGIFVLFPVPQPGMFAVNVLYVLLGGALLASALGMGRAVRLAAALLAIYIYGVRYNYGFNFKAEGGVSVLLFLMVFARCDQALALRPTRYEEEEGAYSWPIQFARSYWIYMLFTAGLFKLRYTGWQWAAGDSIHFVLLRQMYYHYPLPNPPSEVGQFLLAHPWLTWLGSWNTLLAELMAPLMFWGGRVRFLVLGNLLLMLIIVRFSMDHSFFIAHLPLYLSLLPWESWGPRLQRRFQRAA